MLLLLLTAIGFLPVAVFILHVDKYEKKVTREFKSGGLLIDVRKIILLFRQFFYGIQNLILTVTRKFSSSYVWITVVGFSETH